MAGIEGIAPGEADVSRKGPPGGNPSAPSGGVQAATLSSYLSGYLEVERFKDYCPNGLQVEGWGPVHRIVSGVTASEALIRAAIRENAQALLVHHGYFWRGEDPTLTGIRRNRIRLILEHGLHLFAYHLPLDAHATVGKNACLGRLLGWAVHGRFGDQQLGCRTELDRPVSPGRLVAAVSRAPGRKALAVGSPPSRIRTVAWCTGAAQDMLDQAIAVGAQAFVSGEISERTVHLAREAGVLYVAAGHHATERFGIGHVFIDDQNPV